MERPKKSVQRQESQVKKLIINLNSLIFLLTYFKILNLLINDAIIFLNWMYLVI